MSNGQPTQSPRKAKKKSKKKYDPSKYRIRSYTSPQDLIPYNKEISQALQKDDVERGHEILETLIQNRGPTDAEVESEIKTGTEYRGGPDIMTYSLLMTYHARRGNDGACRELFKSLLIQELKPDMIIYTNLLQAYAQQTQLDDCYEVLDMMIKQGLEPDTVVYNHILKVLVQKQNVEGFHELLGVMQSRQIPLTQVTNGLLINLYLELDDLQKAVSVYQTCFDQRKPRLEHRIVNVHNMDHGPAFIAVHLLLENNNRLKIICGKGLHRTRGNMYEMREYLIQRLRKYHPEANISRLNGSLIVKKHV